MNRLRRLISTIRERLAERRERGMPRLEELLEQAGVSRSVTPELLHVAQLAGLRLDGDDGGDDDDDDDNADDDDDDTADDDDAADDDDDDDTADDDDDDDESDAERENKALKRRLAEERKARKKADKALKSTERERQKKSGQYKRMYEEEKERGDGLEQQLRQGSLSRAITSEASRQNFRSPDLAVKLVRDDLKDAVDEDGEVDEDLVRDALKKLAKSERSLVKKSKRQGDVTGDDDDDEDVEEDDDEGKNRNRRRRNKSDDEQVTPRERLRRGHEKIEKERARQAAR